jgi:hypothetical protein
MSEQTAHARRHDPQTSYEAADATTPRLRELQAHVEAYARRIGPGGFTDAQLAADLDDAGSTYRTRRSELTDRNIILDSGQRRTFGPSPRRRIVWVHRDYVANAPAICEPPPSPAQREQYRAQGEQHAAKMEAQATQMANEGRALFAQSLRETAQFIRAATR